MMNNPVINNLLKKRAEVLAHYGEQERFIRENERMNITSISRTTWWRMEREKLAHSRKKISEGGVAWLLSDILLWMSQQQDTA